jgi:hypothetical protein
MRLDERTRAILDERTRAIFETQRAYYTGKITDEQRRAHLAVIMEVSQREEMEERLNDFEDEGEGEPKIFVRIQMESKHRG